MSTEPKSPGGKQQGTTPHGATHRKSGNHKAPRKIAAEDTGTVKREEVAHTAKTSAAASPQKAKAAATDIGTKPKSSAADGAEKVKAAAPHVAKKAKAPVTEAAEKVKAAATASVKKTVSSMPVPELSKDAVGSAMDTIEQSWKAAGLGTVAVNRKILDFARQNVSSGLHLARSLAGAKNPVEMARLHVMFWDEQMKALASQAEELRAMSAELVSKASEPLREHMRKSLSDFGE
jgi:Phasin protein